MVATQVWNPGTYAKHAHFVADLGQPVVTLLDPKPGEHILDLGCGDGALTEKLAAFGCDIRGVDGSAAFVEATRRRGITAEVMDGQSLTFNDEFDAVFSNAALHWMKDAETVIAGVYRALKPNGRFAAEMGGYGNVAEIVTALSDALRKRGIDPALYNPWYFPNVDDYRGLLEKGGFTVEQIELFPRPTPLPGDVTGWLTTFAQNFTTALPESDRAAYLQEVCAALEPKMKGADDVWTADYIRLRFLAVKN